MIVKVLRLKILNNKQGLLSTISIKQRKLIQTVWKILKNKFSLT